MKSALIPAASNASTAASSMVWVKKVIFISIFNRTATTFCLCVSLQRVKHVCHVFDSIDNSINGGSCKFGKILRM